MNLSPESRAIINRVDPERLLNFVRTSGSEAELAAFQYAESVLVDAGFSTRLISHPAITHAMAGSGTIETEVRTGWQQIPLLEATLEPEGTDGSLVLLTGHIGHDNGGTNAAMLEIAAVLAAAPLRRGLRLLFFSGHSQDRHAGSAWYADNHFRELAERALLTVNIDCIGGRGDSVLSLAPAMAEAVPLVKAVIGLVSDETYIGSRIGRNGDQSFSGAGVSSVQIGISLQVQLRDTQLHLALLHEMLTRLVPPLKYSLAAREVAAALWKYQTAAAGRFNLTRAQTQAAMLVGQLEQLEKSIAMRPDPAAWRILRAVARELVPLNYVAGPVHQLAGLRRELNRVEAGLERALIAARTVFPT